MIIGFDGNEANIKNRVGVNTYAYELLKNIQKLQEKGQSQHRLIVYLKDNPLNDMPKESANLKYKVLSGRGMWILRKLMPRLLVNTDDVDIFFSPSHYLPPISRVPMVCSIMDVGYLEFSGQFPKKVFWQLKWWTAISIFVSKYIISISKSTATDIVRHYNWTRNKVMVTPLGYDTDKFNQSISSKDVRHIKTQYSIVEDYILFLGMLKPSKNIEGLISAFYIVVKKFPNIQLVIAGKKGWMYEKIDEKVKNLGLTKKVIFTDFVSEKDKPALIKGAKIFTLPSFWEGFGLDVLSAMALGVPVVTSNVGSLPEVTGKAAILVDPNSTKSIADGLLKVLSMPESAYNNLIKAGLRQVDGFSWEKTAHETLKVLETAHNK